MATTVSARSGNSGCRHRRALFAGCAGNAMEWYDFALFGAATTIRAAVLAPGGFAVDRRPLGPGRSAAVLAATILLMAFARFSTACSRRGR